MIEISPNRSYPLSFRQVEVARVMQVLRAGDSCSLIGVSGMGKSNLFRFLCHPSVGEHFLEQEWVNFLILQVDIHALAEVNEAAIYDLFFERLILAMEAQKVERGLIDQIAALHKEAEPQQDRLIWLKYFSRALRTCARIRPFRFVFMLDQFDELYRTLEPRFFVNLRALRDEHKDRLTFIIFSRDELPAIRDTPELDEFNELVRAHSIGIGPYLPADARLELEHIARRYGQVLTPEFSEHLFSLTGGHPGLLRACYLSSLPAQIADSPQATRTGANNSTAMLEFLEYAEVLTECKKLQESLREDELKGLRTLLQTPGAASGPDVIRRLRMKGILNQADQVFSPLFKEYLARTFTARQIETRLQAGPIRIDTSGEVWVGAVKVESQLTGGEMRLLTYLCSRPNQLCSKDEVIINAYPEKFAQGETVSDEAINQLVKRLRQRIEDNPGEPKFILTVRGKGYMLKV
jgi:hypothetical protein